MHSVPSRERFIKEKKKKMEFCLWMQRPAPDLHLNQFHLNDLIQSTLISQLSFLAPTFFCVNVGRGTIWPLNVNTKKNRDNVVGREFFPFARFYFLSGLPSTGCAVIFFHSLLLRLCQCMFENKLRSWPSLAAHKTNQKKI